MFVIKDRTLPINFVTNSDQPPEKCMEGAITKNERQWIAMAADAILYLYNKIQWLNPM
jgi:hypothetical protein